MNTYGGPVTVASLIAVLAVLLACAMYFAQQVAGGVQHIAAVLP